MKSYINGLKTRDSLEMYYRDENGDLQCDAYPAEDVAFFKSNDVTSLMRHDRRVASWTKDAHGWMRAVFKPGRWEADRPNKWTGGLGMFVPFREAAIKEWGVDSFEGDVSAVRRFMSDHPETGIAKPKRCYFDIETDSRVKIEDAIAGKARILCWTVTNNDKTERWRGVLSEDTDEAEARLLNELWCVFDQFDQAASWNGDSFDTPVVRKRSKQRSVQEIRRLLFIDHMQAYKRHNISNSDSGEMKQSFALNVVATNELGYGKHDFDASKTYEAWAAGGEERQRMVDYCAQDTDLMPDIEAKTGYLDVVQSVAELTGIFPDSRSLKPTHQVDGYLLRLGHTQGHHFRSKFFDDESIHVKFPGAYVMPPKAEGLTENVIVGDFASLYPNIIRTWNLSPDAKDPEGHCISPSNGVRTSERRVGIMCFALTQLLTLRKELKERGDKRGEKAVKIVANSFYGVLGTPYSRFYDRELCEATTQNGAWLIKTTIEEAEKKGWKVIYADTDSLFVVGATEDDFRAFLTWCNTELYPTLTTAQGVQNCTLELAFDKSFERIVFTAAKRYVGKMHGKDKPVIKGVEYMRGDINKLARQLQKSVIDLIVAGETELAVYERLVGECRERVATEPLTRDFVVITKSVGELDEYDSNPPQLRVAEILKARGHDIRPGTRVGFVVLDGYSSPKKVIPAEDYTGCEVDRDALWNLNVYPATKRLLDAAFPLGPWGRWLRKGKPKHRHDPRQQSLF